MVLRAVLIWCALLVVASINGAIRQAVLIPRIGDVAGRAVSTLSLSALIVILTAISIRWIRPGSAGRAWAVGVIWVALTLAFEFLAGHYLFHNSGADCWKTTTSFMDASGYSPCSRR